MFYLIETHLYITNISIHYRMHSVSYLFQGFLSRSSFIQIVMCELQLQCICVYINTRDKIIQYFFESLYRCTVHYLILPMHTQVILSAIIFLIDAYKSVSFNYNNFFLTTTILCILYYF